MVRSSAYHLRSPTHACLQEIFKFDPENPKHGRKFRAIDYILPIGSRNMWKKSKSLNTYVKYNVWVTFLVFFSFWFLRHILASNRKSENTHTINAVVWPIDVYIGSRLWPTLFSGCKSPKPSPKGKFQPNAKLNKSWTERHRGKIPAAITRSQDRWMAGMKKKLISHCRANVSQHTALSASKPTV